MQSAGSSGSCCSNTFFSFRQHRERRGKELFVGHEIGIMVLAGIHAVARHEIRAFLLLHRAVGVLFELHLGARLEAQLHAVELVKALRRNLVDEAALAHTAHLVAGKRLPIVGKMLFGIVAGADIRPHRHAGREHRRCRSCGRALCRRRPAGRSAPRYRQAPASSR